MAGSVGISGDTSDKDEMIAVLAIASVGRCSGRLSPDPGEPPEGGPPRACRID